MWFDFNFVQKDLLISTMSLMPELYISIIILTFSYYNKERLDFKNNKEILMKKFDTSNIKKFKLEDL